MRLSSISLLFIFLLSPVLIYAQSGSPVKADAKIEVSSEKSEREEAQATVSETVADERPADSAPVADPVKQKEPELSSKTKPSGKVFKPSEEISEDRPVPFPVDI
ncbi:MAG: hypothetical protein ACI9FR_001120 [Cryomorphaceae bacterium]|jgi:hypothetical protein